VVGDNSINENFTGDQQQASLWEQTSSSAEESRDLFKKHRAIIHRTHGNTVMEEKIFNGLLYVAKVAMRTEVDPKKGFVTTEKYLKSFSGLRTKNREYLRSTLDSLQSKLWKFDFFDQDEALKELRVFSPISEARYSETGEIKFFLPPTLVEVLSNPEVFAAIDSKMTARLQSVYSIVLYEMGQAYMDTSMTFDNIPEFRKYMGLKNDEYTSFGDLRRHVIDKGCNEVNLKTDTRVEYDLLRQGRKVMGVTFSFTRSTEPIELPENLDQLEIVIELSALLPEELRGITWVVSLLTSAVSKKGVEWTKSNIDAVMDRINSKVGGPVKSPGALLRTAFKADYGKAVRDAKIVQVGLKERESRVETQRNEHAQSKQRQDEDDNTAYIEEVDAYNVYFAGLPKEEQEQVLAQIAKIKSLAGPQHFKVHFYLKEHMNVVLPTA
jgi:hypothetical protein